MADGQNWQIWLAAMLLVAVWTGCGKQTNEAGNPGGTKTGSSPAPAAAIKHYKLDQLPELDDSLPPLDGGRVEVSPPKEWNSLSREAKYVARFVHNNQKAFPRISIKVMESSLPEITNLSKQNARSVASKLVLGAQESKDLPESNKPIILGDNVWVRHVRRATADGDKVAIQSLQTIRGSRLYNIELFVAADSAGNYKEALEKYRNLAYAVAGRMKFLKDEAKISGDETEESEVAEPQTKSPDSEPAEETMPAKPDANPVPDANLDPNGNPTPPSGK